MSDNLIAVAVDTALAFAFPQGCHVCGRRVERHRDRVACVTCWRAAETSLQLRDRTVCGRCGMPGSGACARCAPQSVSLVRSAAEFAGAVRAALLDLKRRPVVCDRLASMLLDAFDAEPSLGDVDLITPVPLHASRLAERGHNQAELLGAVVARSACVALEPRALARVRSSERRRAGAGRSHRSGSVSGAFRASRAIVRERRVLVVDDLYTTGATAGACADALRAAGAADVRVLTAARAMTARGV